MKLSEFLDKTKHLPPDTEVILVDPDTNWLLIPYLMVDEDGINLTAYYDKQWTKPL
jgi:hypothetical protein